MATKSIELQLKIQGASTIAEMEENLNDVNDQLKQVDVNSQAFKDLTKAAQEANDVLAKTNEEIAGISSLEKAEGAVKLGEGLVGGFQAAQAASALFGAETAEAMQKAADQATLLFTGLDGLKKVTEAFSAQNIKAYKGIVSGLKESTIGAKLFGTTTKAAIAGTGIGLLIIGIAALIANWEAVTKSVREFGESIPFIKTIIDGVDSLIEKVGSISNLFKALGAGIKGAFTIGTSAVDEFNKSLADSKATDEFNKALEKISKNVTLLGSFLQTGVKEYENAVDDIIGKLDDEIKALERQKELTNDIVKQKELEDQIQDKILEKEQNRKILLDDLQKLYDVFLNDTVNEYEKLIEAEQASTNNADKILELRQKQNDVLNLQETLSREIATNEFNINKILFERKNITDLIAKSDKFRIEDLKSIRDFNLGELETSERLLANKKQLSEEEKNNLRRNIAGQLNLLQLIRAANAENKDLNENTTIFLDEYQRRLEILSVGLDTIGEVAFNGFQIVIDNLSQRLGRLNEELTAISSEYDNFQAKQLENEELLKDANGERFIQIQDELKNQGIKEAELLKAKQDAENKIIATENRLAQTQYKQDIANASINAALAVIQALPNPFLAAAAGIAAASQIAVIASNKPVKKQPVEYMEGGFTPSSSSDSTPVGVVHANEFVIPAKVLRTSEGSRMAQTLEAMRTGMKGFKDGGFTTPNAAGNVGIETQGVVSALENAKIYVSVVEIDKVRTNVKVIESRASI